MTGDQELHLINIKNDFREEVDNKYRAGQKEHGGNLFDMSLEDLAENLICEAIDAYVYAHTLRTKIREQNSPARKP